jgi:hypothetical protein
MPSARRVAALFDMAGRVHQCGESLDRERRGYLGIEVDDALEITEKIDI